MRTILFILSWMALFLAFATMFVAVLLLDPIRRPGTIQAIIGVALVVMLAAMIGVIKCWPPEKYNIYW